MSKIISFFSIILAVNLIFSQPWIERISGVTVQLTSISAIDPQYQWICGYSGTVLRSTNTGVNWINVSGNGIPSTIQLINIWGIDQNNALVAGYISTNTWVYRTSNAGANWVQVFNQTGGFINAVYIGLSGNGFMMGDPVGGRWSLWKTTNSGVNWDSAGLYLPQAGTEAGYNNCLAAGMNRIWFGTSNSRIYYSSNNGTNWVIQNVSPETQITAIWFDENGSSTGYCGGNNILKTTDYGSNWSSIGGLGTGAIVGIAGLTMWGGNLWYVRSGNPNIYFGFGTGSWFQQYTAPAGTYRHVTTDRIPNFPFLGFAVRTNGGISFTQIFVQGLKNLGGEIPSSFKLHQNYPNPFNPVTKIKFSLPLPSQGGTQIVSLIIYDVLGREVASLLPPLWGGQVGLQPGIYEVEWDASNYPTGTYFYKLTSGVYSETKKMVLLK